MQTIIKVVPSFLNILYSVYYIRFRQIKWFDCKADSKIIQEKWKGKLSNIKATNI